MPFIKRYRLSIEEILYYAAVILFFFTKGIGLEEGEVLFRLCFFAGALLILGKLMIGQYSLKEINIIGVLGIWGVITFKITGSLGMMIYIFLIVGMKSISVQKVFRVGAATWGICMFYTFTAAIFFERTGARRVHEKFGLGSLLRESLGYTHPNVLHVTYVVFMAFILYQTKKEGKKLFKQIALLLLGNLFVFIYSLSLTGLLFSFIYLGLFFYFRKRKKLCKLERGLIQLLLPVCVIVSLFLPLFIKDGPIFKMLNTLLNSRVWAIRYFYENYPVTILGMNSAGMTFSLDNSYIYALMAYGIGFILIMTLAYSLLIRHCIKLNKGKELAIICSFLIAALSEPFMFNASVKNLTVFFLGEYLYKVLEGGKIVYKPFEYLNTKREFIFNSGNIAGNIFNIADTKLVWILFAVISIICCILIPKNFEGIENVYVNESMCDCGGDTITLPEIDESDNALYIPSADKDVRYYHFTDQNSKLIAVMDLRKRISISIYTAALGCMILILFQIWRKYGRTAKKESGFDQYGL